MKYTVKFSCGHEEEMQIYGKAKAKEKKIKYLSESGICSKCYKEMMNEKNSENCEEVRMSYREYKENYADCKTKSGSYDKEEKTIIVYVPVSAEVDAKEICQKALEIIVRNKRKKAEEVTPADVYAELTAMGYNVQDLDMPENIKGDIIGQKEHWS